MTYCVNYKLIREDGEVEKDLSKEACFSYIMNRMIDKNIKKIVVYHPKNEIVYSEAECKEWVELINEIGFDVTYEGIGSCLYKTGNNDHVFIIDLKKGNNSERAYCISILNLIRYLWEEYLTQIPKLFWELSKEYNIKTIDDKFQLIQYVHGLLSYESNFNHSLRERGGRKCISLKTFKKRVKKLRKEKATLYKSKSFSLFDLWKGAICAQNSFEKLKEKDNMNVYVVGGDTGYANWLPVNVKIVKRVENAELIIFTGGEDVHPSLYNEPVGHNTYTDIERDKIEKKIFEQAVELKIPILGVCRGSQLSCIMNGGRLVQHQNQSGYIHPIETNKYGTIKISSTHHQAQFPFELSPWEYRIIGWTTNESKCHLDGNGNEMNPPKECEIVYYPETRCLAIQGHPEYEYYQESCPEDLEVIKKIFTDFINDKI